MMRVLILLALIGAAVAVPKHHSRIVGGTATTVDVYPYMANMQYAWFGFLWSQACGGSLITTTSILSAADCYRGDTIWEWRALLGTSYRLAGYGGTTHYVTQLIVHEQYNLETVEYDVAIVKLSTPAILSATIFTVSIAGPNFNLPDGTPLTALGWGALSSGGTSPELLQHVEVNIINQQVCAERYAYLKTLPDYQNWPDITDRMLCAGILDVGGKDTCHGDVGGPLVHNNNVLVGIASWGLGCADPFYPGVNARVSALTDWIVSNA